MSEQLRGKTAVITGASRGIGAETAKALASHGVNIVATYQSRVQRMESVARGVKTTGAEIVVVQADITDASDRRKIIEAARENFGTIDFLILNAAGGLEKEKANEPNWPFMINLEAQMGLVEEALFLVSCPGGKIIYLPSLWSHRYGELEQLPYYEPVAKAKHGCELELRELGSALKSDGISVGFVCAHIVDGTATKLLLERNFPELMQELKQTTQDKKFPSAGEVAHAIVQLLASDFESGTTVYVGGREALPILLYRDFWDRAYIEERLFLYGKEAIFVDTFFPDPHGESGVATFTVTDAHCHGHFADPNLRVCPAHILIEVAAQASYLLWLSRNRGMHSVPLFEEVYAKMLRPALPRQEVHIVVVKKTETSSACILWSGNRRIAEMEITGAIVSMQTARRLLYSV